MTRIPRIAAHNLLRFTMQRKAREISLDELAARGIKPVQVKFNGTPQHFDHRWKDIHARPSHEPLRECILGNWMEFSLGTRKGFYLTNFGKSYDLYPHIIFKNTLYAQEIHPTDHLLHWDAKYILDMNDFFHKVS